MSRQTVTKSIRCDSDHGYTACPGHTLSVTFHFTSMMVSIEVDGAERLTCDSQMWKALREIMDETRETML